MAGGPGVGVGAKGSFARAIQGNNLCENEAKEQLQRCIRALSLPSRNKFTKDPKSHLALQGLEACLQRLEAAHETLTQARVHPLDQRVGVRGNEQE